MLPKLLAVFVFFGVYALAPAPVTWLTEMTYDMGDIVHDEPVTIEFRYRNDADEPLVIDNVRTSCGCTTSEWALRPIAPDSVGVVKVEYDARSLGYFRKYVKVYFHGHRRAEKLWMEGFVEPKD